MTLIKYVPTGFDLIKILPIAGFTLIKSVASIIVCPSELSIALYFQVFE